MSKKVIKFDDKLEKSIQDYANKNHNGNFTRAVNQLADLKLCSRFESKAIEKIKVEEYHAFFDLARDTNSNPFAAQVNKDDDFYGWVLCQNVYEPTLLSDTGKILVWETIDALIESVFEHGELYFMIKAVYSSGGFPLDLSGVENIEYTEHKKLVKK